MNRVIVAFRSVGVSFAIVLLAHAAPATAAPPQRTFVRSDGNDASPTCSLIAPCRTFNVAIGVANAGGEVVILDTAGYGPFTITKSIKVIGPSGVYGGISVQGGAGATTGIVINAGDTDVITLRGLDISGVTTVAPFPNIGIDVQNAGTVHVEKTSISSFPQDNGGCMGVVSPKPIKVFVNDGFFRECTVGIFAQGTGPDDASRISLVIDNTRIQDGVNATVPGGSAAVGVIDAVVATIRNSVLSWAGDGIFASNANANVKNRIHVIGSQFTRFGRAIETDGTSVGSMHVVMTNAHFNNNNIALAHGHGQAIFTSSVVANNTFSLVDCGGGAANVTSLGYGGGNGTNTITNNTDSGPFPSGCTGIITPTQFQGK